MKLISWLIFGWFAPFMALVVLYLKVAVLILTALAKVFVWMCQQFIKVAGKVITKAEKRIIEYKNRRHVVA